MTQVSLKDINRVNFREGDDVGYVFTWNNRVFRAISNNAIDETKALLNSGLIKKLVAEKLFPKTWISDVKFENIPFVLEHEKVGLVSYPYEWCFSMLKDAAICVLKTNKIANEFGYQTKDCHGYNIIFKNTTPYFVDLGSFIKKDKTYSGWIAQDEFKKCYYYPLQIWKKGNNFLAQLINEGAPNFIPHYEYYTYKHSWLRVLPPNFLNGLLNKFSDFKKISFFDDERTLKKAPLGLGPTLVRLKHKKLLPFQSFSFKKWIRKVERIKYKPTNTMWGNYHNWLINNEKVGSTKRFDRIAEITNNNNIQSALEVGGNQGVFSYLLTQKTGVKSVICTDYDTVAVEQLYNNLKTTELPITPVVLNFAFPVVKNHKLNPDKRLKAEAVYALALLHHLILTQKVPINTIFEYIKGYSTKYVFIEFMPLGLYSNATLFLDTPKWYTVDWFRKNFVEHFDLIKEEQLEKNRILFFGSLK